MTVTVKGWNDRSAVAFVDGTRVRVRRTRGASSWTCDEHGADTEPHCLHLHAFAAEPAMPEKRTKRR